MPASEARDATLSGSRDHELACRRHRPTDDDFIRGHLAQPDNAINAAVRHEIGCPVKFGAVVAIVGAVRAPVGPKVAVTCLKRIGSRWPSESRLR